MAQQIINVGASANDGTGDTLRLSQQKTNDNTTELYNSKLESIVAGTNITVDNTDPLNPVINASGGGSGSTLGLIKIVDKAGNFFTNLSTASAYIRTFTSATITDESYSNGTFWFTVPNGSSFANNNGFLSKSTSHTAYIEDTLELISFLGNNALNQSSGNSILGNVRFGTGSLSSFSGILRVRNVTLVNTSDTFALSSKGRFEIYGNIGTTEGANYTNFFSLSTAVIWAQKAKETSNAGGIEGDLATAQTNGAKLFFGYATAGGGDMTKAVYDTEDDGVVDSAKKEIVNFINKSGYTITKGTIVYLKTSSSSSLYPEVLKANAATEATSSKTIGAVFEDVLNDGIGYIVTSGEVRNLDTSSYVIGDKLWLSTTDGLVTTTVPTQPNHAVFIGTVTRAQSVNGRVLYAIQNGYEIEELHNVLITTPLNNQVLAYETSSLLWKNKTISQGTPLTRQEFAYTSSQDFTLSSTPAFIAAVFVNGQELNSSQYSTATTTLTIVDTLEVSDKVNIIYAPATSGILEYYTKTEIDAFNYEEKHANFVEVNDVIDFPSSSGGVITLVAGYTYLVLKHIDLSGSRIVCGADTTIVGWSSENCSISSTGLSAGTALITSVYSLPIRNISFTHGTVFDLQGDGTTTALDWFGVNILNSASAGTIKDYTNFVAGDSALLNSGGFTFDGTIGTIAFSNCLFDTAATTTAITVLATCTVSRRLRVIYSSFVNLSGETGVNFNSSATVSDEKYILDTCNFSGGGTYLSGIDATSNKALFNNCSGITNTSTRGFLHMIDNATATSISSTSGYFKAAGTTSASSANSKFTSPSSNRLTYVGAFTQSFFVTLNCNVRTSVSTQTVNIVIAKNGTILTDSEMTILCAAGSTPSFGGTQTVIELTTNDYIELFVRNTSSVNNVIVSDLNMNILKIPV